MRLFLTLALALLTTACDAQPDQGKGKKKKGGGKKSPQEAVANTPGLTLTGALRVLRESSGIALADKPGEFYTHGDHGNAPVLYRINWAGDVLSRVDVPGAAAEDWEALAHDDQGRLFIADVGNNANNRRDLTIYRFDPRQPRAEAARIRFRYADQQAFPPADKTARNFDCEAVIWRDGTLYLFTRDRGQHRRCRIYSLPATPGEATAKPVGAYDLPGEVSGADLSPDGRQLALVGHEQLYLITLKNPNELLGGQVRTVNLRGAGQTEGVAFTDDRTLIITSEQGTIYRYELSAAGAN